MDSDEGTLTALLLEAYRVCAGVVGKQAAEELVNDLADLSAGEMKMVLGEIDRLRKEREPK
jgi:hypothetical protein